MIVLTQIGGTWGPLEGAPFAPYTPAVVANDGTYTLQGAPWIWTGRAGALVTVTGAFQVDTPPGLATDLVVQIDTPIPAAVAPGMCLGSMIYVGQPAGAQGFDPQGASLSNGALFYDSPGTVIGFLSTSAAIPVLGGQSIAVAFRYLAAP